MQFVPSLHIVIHGVISLMCRKLRYRSFMQFGYSYITIHSTTRILKCSSLGEKKKKKKKKERVTSYNAPSLCGWRPYHLVAQLLWASCRVICLTTVPTQVILAHFILTCARTEIIPRRSSIVRLLQAKHAEFSSSYRSILEKKCALCWFK